MVSVFVLPVTTEGQVGPVAAYMSTGGWAAAAQRVLGDEAWIVCPSGTIDPSEARRRGTSALAPAPAPRARRRVPVMAKTLVKDLRQLRRARAFTIDPVAWRDRRVDFVWQRHGIFQTAGLDLADALGRPSVLFVPATQVWEADRWGTRRPGWGRLLERRGEEPALRRANVVACGSPEVATQAQRMGTPVERIVITPTGVDVDLFAPAASERAIRRRELGLADRFVVAWVGSFRPFHSLGRAVDAVARVPGATLLLVGDGPERPAIVEHARRRAVPTVTTGTVHHDDLPGYLAAADVGLVLAAEDEGFHYSPLKLAEYLACGLAVVAPRVPPVEARLTDGLHALLVDPGDEQALVDALTGLRDDPGLRGRLAEGGRALARAEWSWDEQVRRVRDALDRAGHPPHAPTDH